ncbi:MAG: DUF3054 domain-containing protein [Ktedonobacteraceae bacterium]|nr:DUF3054 domain-containing protein [Ktedonobacteraceae bacterium]
MAVKERSAESTEQALDNKNTVSRTVALVLGDVVVFLVFAAIGRRSHGEEAGLSAVLQVVTTAIPFLLGWFLVAPFIGAFRRDIQANPLKMVQRTALAWLAAWPVAMLLRGLLVDHAIPPWTFWLVAFISNTVFLQIWRLPYALIMKRSKRV